MHNEIGYFRESIGRACSFLFLEKTPSHCVRLNIYVHGPHQIRSDFQPILRISLQNVENTHFRVSQNLKFDLIEIPCTQGILFLHHRAKRDGDFSHYHFKIKIVAWDWEGRFFDVRKYQKKSVGKGYYFNGAFLKILWSSYYACRNLQSRHTHSMFASFL